MKILFIAHRVPYPPNKGEKLRAFWELRELSKRHTIDLFCFYDDDRDVAPANELSRYCRLRYMEKLPFVESRLRALSGLLQGQPFSVAFFQSARMRKEIEAAIRSERYDRIVVFSSSMAQYAGASDAIPKVLDMVDVDSDKWAQYAKRSPWPWSWLWRKEAYLLGKYEGVLTKTFDSTIVCTEAEAQLLRSRASVGNIRVLENLVDATLYVRPKEPLPDDVRRLQPYVIFSGSMDYRPNIDAVQYFCREAFPAIRAKMPEIRFVIAGRNPARSIVGLRREPGIEVTGGVADMRPYLWGASMAVVPLRIARGIQNKILEAIASGTAVVSSSLAASTLPDPIRSCVTVADSAGEICDAVINVLGHRCGKSGEQLQRILYEYMNSLDLPGRLHDLIADPAGRAQNKLHPGPKPLGESSGSTRWRTLATPAN